MEILHLLVARLSLSSITIASSSTPGPSSVEREKKVVGGVRRVGGELAGEGVVQSVQEEAASVLAERGCPLVCVGVGEVVLVCVGVGVCEYVCLCVFVHIQIYVHS